LRERREDIPLLVAHFLKNKIHAESGKGFQVTRKVMDVLGDHDWPGNVRELENALERASVLCDAGILKVADLPPVLRNRATVGNEASDDAEIFPCAVEGSTESNFSIVNESGVPSFSTAANLSPLKNFLREQELAYLNRVLAHTGGDKEKTAELLGVSIATLYRKLSEEEEPAA
jgi:DNA-binding NtrC family response regulator